MKKKHIIIPIACGLLVLVIGVLAVFLTTDVSYKLHYEKFSEKYLTYTFYDDYRGEQGPTEPTDWFYLANNCGKSMNRAYRLNPSFKNLKACRAIYPCRYYTLGKYLGQEAPSDYLEYCLKYSKAMYETPYDSTKIKDTLTLVDQKLYWDFTKTVEYATALYLNSDIPKSKAVAEEAIKLAGNEALIFTEIKDYFYYVYATTEDEALKAWVLEKEEDVEYLVKYSGKFDYYFEHHEHFFTNPDIDTYFCGEWEEYRDLY